MITLATNGPEGLWAAAVFYAHQDFTFYFLSAGPTRHAKNINTNPWVAATIQTDYTDWPEIQGIQIEGSVKKLLTGEAILAIKMFVDRFPFLENANPNLLAALGKVDWFRLDPAKLFFVDNRKGFGHRDEIFI